MPIIDILDLRLGRGEVARLTEGIAIVVSKVVDAALVEVVKDAKHEMFITDALRTGVGG